MNGLIDYFCIVIDTHRHNSSVKHVVIESRRDPVTGVLYNITPNGPSFSSLYELIVEAQTRPLIHNHSFNIQLTCSPPKVGASILNILVPNINFCLLLF